MNRDRIEISIKIPNQYKGKVLESGLQKKIQEEVTKVIKSIDPDMECICLSHLAAYADIIISYSENNMEVVFYGVSRSNPEFFKQHN